MLKMLIGYFAKKFIGQNSGLLLLKKAALIVGICFLGVFISILLLGLLISAVVAGIAGVNVQSSANDTVFSSVYMSDSAPLPEETKKWLSGDVDINPAFACMLAALAKKHGAAIYISSGYRSVEEQRVIWEERKRAHPGEPDEVTRKWVALPGKSMHQTGMAADVSGYAELLSNDELINFGLWKPLGNEPWHIEPIGTQKIRNVEKEKID
ncbi:MAG TPA: M15 family metallopeptidase [Clostridia bacterium]|nr:M15 family metallopeptidase [Clostridia bacterium]